MKKKRTVKKRAAQKQARGSESPDKMTRAAAFLDRIELYFSAAGQPPDDIKDKIAKARIAFKDARKSKADLIAAYEEHHKQGGSTFKKRMAIRSLARNACRLQTTLYEVADTARAYCLTLEYYSTAAVFTRYINEAGDYIGRLLWDLQCFREKNT